MAGTDRKDTFKALKYALGGARGDRIVHELGIATPPWPQTERAVAKKERAIDAAAKKFYQACQDTSLASPTLKSYVDFLLMQTLYFECRQYLPADNAFYRDKTYYFDTHVNPIKSIAAKLIVKVVIRIMKEIGPGNVAWPEANRKG